MADVYCVVSQSVTLSTPTRKMQLSQPLAYDNALAHSMRVIAYNDDGTDADLTGVSAVGSFMKADGGTVTPITGTVNGNVAEVVLPESCYLSPGRFKFTLNLTNTDGAARTALWVEGMVEKNISGTIIDPGTPVGNIAQAIGQATAAANTANTAADRADAAAELVEGFGPAIAPTFEDLMATSPFVPLTAGLQHCWYDGTLYVNAVDIESSESWNASHWTAVDVSGELAKKADADVLDGYVLKTGVATLADTLTYLSIP